jgi:hypothetical protein
MKTLRIVGRTVFWLFTMRLLVHAWQTAAPPAAGCQAAGQVYGWDIHERTFTLQSDSGHYSDYRYDDSTKFTNGEVPIKQDVLDLNIDDRLCVEAFSPGKQDVASRVQVTFRSDIDAQDKRELVRWQSESVFGAVKSWDARDRKMIVSVPSSGDVSVDAAGPLAFWILPTGADDAGDVIRGSWDTLVAGDPIYIRGERTPGAQTVRARMVVSGGFRSFAGSVQSMQPLTEQLVLRDFQSGRRRPVHFDFTSIYVVGKTSAPGSRDRRMYPATVGDLKTGDSVLILGRDDKQNGGTEAFLLITGFSPGGVVQPGPGQSPDWIFQAVGFGESRQ